MNRIGIDLGTTNTLCSYWPADAPRPQLIPIQQPVVGPNNKFESREYLPSAVQVKSEQSVFAGEKVKLDSLSALNIEQKSYFLSMKKRMGTTYMREINGLRITPEWISACLLQVVRRAAQNHIGATIDEAVITVPASFSTEQRAATLRAAKLAGLPTRIKLVDEPTAALCHALHERGDVLLSKDQHPQYIMMIDIGGGTFDVSIVEVSRKERTLDITLLGCSRYNEMAGDDFDLYIAAFLLNQMEKQRDFDYSELKPDAAVRLAVITLDCAQKAKENLSHQLAQKRVDNPIRYNLKSMMEELFIPFEIGNFLGRGEPYRDHFSLRDFGVALKRFLPDLAGKHRDRDSRLYSYTFARPIEEAIKSVRQSSEAFAGFSYFNLHKVLLTGGSARLPFLEETIHKIVSLRPEILTDPMNSVALGASVFGAWTAGERGEQVHLHERLYDSVFLQTADGHFEEILSKNSLIPLDNYRCQTKNLLKISGGVAHKQIELRLFLGQNAEDPFMAPMTTSHILHFPEPVPSETPIEIHCSVGPDRCFNFTFTALLHDGRELKANAEIDQGHPDLSLKPLPTVNLVPS